MLMMCRRSSMVHLLIRSLLLAALMLSLDLHLRMSSNLLSLNPNKTHFIWFGTPQQLSKLNLPLLTERFPSFAFHSSVRNLGGTLTWTAPLPSQNMLQISLDRPMLCYMVICKAPIAGGYLEALSA